MIIEIRTGAHPSRGAVIGTTTISVVNAAGATEAFFTATSQHADDDVEARLQSLKHAATQALADYKRSKCEVVTLEDVDG